MARFSTLTLALLISCGGEAKAPPAPATPAPAPAAAADSSAESTAAQVGDRVITMAEVDEGAARDLTRARQEMFDARNRVLNGLINRHLVETEAKARGVSAEQLVKAEVQDKVPTPPPEEVRSFYDANVNQMQGATFEQAAPQIAAYLQNQGMAEVSREFYGALRARTPVKINLEPPRYEVHPADSPRYGSVDAPIQIIEFSDFECPYCTRAAETVQQVKEEYGDKISLVYRHYPLPMHANAPRAAEAAECVHDQDAEKFWAYHDLLFANQQKMSDADLTAHAKTVGANEKKFAKCLEAGTNRTKVDRDKADGDAIGITGTPVFYINGRMLHGAVPFDNFADIIDDELARLSG